MKLPRSFSLLTLLLLTAVCGLSLALYSAHAKLRFHSTDRIVLLKITGNGPPIPDAPAESKYKNPQTFMIWLEPIVDIEAKGE